MTQQGLFTFSEAINLLPQKTQNLQEQRFISYLNQCFSAYGGPLWWSMDMMALLREHGQTTRLDHVAFQTVQDISFHENDFVNNSMISRTVLREHFYQQLMAQYM